MSQVDDKLVYLEETKSIIRDAIQKQGVDINEDDTFRSYADKIANIEGKSSFNCMYDTNKLNYSEDDYRSTIKEIITSISLKDLVLIDKDAGGLFGGMKSLVDITDADNLGELRNCGGMFENCTDLVTTPKLKIAKSESETGNMFGGCKSLKTINIDNVGTSCQSMFAGCQSLEYLPNNFDFSYVTSIKAMVLGCTSLKEFNYSDFPNVADATYLFQGCTSLKRIPSMNLAKCELMSGMFASCENLESIGQIECDSCYIANNIFDYYINKSYINLTDIEGFNNLGKALVSDTPYAWDNCISLYLQKCPNLTHTSLMNIINKIYDITQIPKEKGGHKQTITLCKQSAEKLTDEEIAIATSKGWTVQIA